MIKLFIKIKSKIFSELLSECILKDEDFKIIKADNLSDEVPDIVITDKYELKNELINRHPESKIFLIDTGIPREELISLLIKYKLKGILSMNSDISHLKKALKVIYSGQTWISDELVKCLIEFDRFNNVVDIKLTDKEKKIMKLVCEGLSNKEIAAKLFISEQTVKAHLHRIYQKLAIKNRPQLAVIYSKIFNQ
ncbi:MAG: response regulator transcription factor [Thermodesulfovibrio sp.]|uniref:response regulator transcription factor n=1 Tax=unclassified Thermodesulfovibrio TaxID=2645936 RepID=UPI00083AE739|nr:MULTISPECIES: response regulator transcription factor [unclassified Thermodesulfovibrio]MDI1472786.1 response regulator transcription factor [Thermodesulfovibrio sp. 1176]MDI6713485.1 response regulator transcription factor [Thermodesulfovibrio sp.]ODA44569.1 Transcriptional regulator CsgD for 2nd curli operon [Thermodesulfovibrio sp. N1]